MSAVDTQFYDKKRNNFFYMALSFLVFVVLATLGLFFYNSRLLAKNTDIQSQIDTLSTSISEVESHKDVQVYSIYSQNKQFLDTLSQNSKLSSFVAHIKKNLRKYGLEGQGFNYAGGVVTVSLSSQTNDTGYAYEKVVKFLREYNLQGEEKSPFILQKISAFAGYDTINYTAQFKIPNNF